MPPVSGVRSQRGNRTDGYTYLLEALGRAGRPGLELAVRLDLLRSLGPRHALNRRREEARAAARVPGGMRPGYREIWLDAAREIGAEATELGDGFIDVRRGDESTLVWNSWVPLDDAVTLRFADHKLLARPRLDAAGLPVPEHALFEPSDPSPAFAFLEARSGPCVVKPADSAGGSGATSGVRTPRALRRASLRAARISAKIVIEAQIPGDLYRLLFLEGELVDAVRRLPPRVTGDGRATIAELVAAENQWRVRAGTAERTGLLRLDLDSVLTLEHVGLGVRSVPAAGERLAVKSVVNQNSAEDNASVRDEVGKALVADAEAAVRAVGVRLAGVDLITPDPSVRLSEAGGAILEVNGGPGLHYHYDVSNPGQAVPVAVPILERLLR
jgi:D-alanine-D-alanine ligase-like ATP-grasp enzyme